KLTAQVEGLPWNDPHWHPAHGGIYRDVYLYITEPVHVTLPLFSNLGTVGNYAYATNVSAEGADIGVETQVQNERKDGVGVECTSEVIDRDGKTVLTLGVLQKLDPGEKQIAKATGKLAKPQLWEPDYPYLYTVVTTVKLNGQAIDRV